ncbi:Tol-Pal system beta propeller repeat-containing protein TolB [Candidatus Magnetoovum chiemensis]|nr:Tol-Pal system beta propeller repeat-containing protein TolB [Candidatus Magnetoovum chiemensis]
MKKNLTLFAAALFLTLCSYNASAKVYIDIHSPGAFKFPVAIEDLASTKDAGVEISDIIRHDFTSTGYFTIADKSSYIESSKDPFDQNNWRPLKVDAVVKGSVGEDIERGSEFLNVQIAVFDVSDSSKILNKTYIAKKTAIRTLAHKIADEIFTAITGQKGMFNSKIAFVGKTKEFSAVYVMDWDGERIERLAASGEVTMSPRWSETGSKLVYSSLRNDRWNIYTLDVNEGYEKLVYSSGSTDLAGCFASGDGEILLSSSEKGSPDIYRYNINSSKAEQLTWSEFIEVSPRVSPDKRQIVYVSNRSGSPQLYIMDINGYENRRLTFKGSYNTTPDWAGSGELITFTSMVGGRFQIFTITPDGSDLTQLTSRGNNEEPSFSPDGRFITFTSDRDGVKRVYIMRADGEEQQRVSPLNIEAFGPSWSPF